MSDDEILRKGPIEGLPFYTEAARSKAGPFDQTASISDHEINLVNLYRFALCNCGFTPEDLNSIGSTMMVNLVKNANAPIWRALLQIYLLGLRDGAAMQAAQAELDVQEVAKGRVM